MVDDAEKFKDEDQLIKDTIDAKNEFEGMLYQTKTSIENKDIKEKISDDECEILSNLIKESETWLEENQNKTKDDYDTRKDEFNMKVQPIMSKIYNQTKDAENNNESNVDPVIDEID